MKITQVKIIKVEKEQSRFKAYANVTLDNCFAVNGIRIIDGDQGMFLSFPSKKRNDGTYEDMCFPTNKETRELFMEAVLGRYYSGDDDRPINNIRVKSPVV